MVTATDRTKLIGTNQILSVFMDNIDFCAKNTQFASRRLKSSMQELVWQSGYKKSGSDVAYGSKNSVSGIITGVNQDKLNGSRGVLYLIEEAGIFKNLREMYNMIRPSVEQGSSVFGEIYMYGTAGDDQSDFTAFAEMFYSPEGYNLYGLDNVYDKEGQGRKQCGFFYPAYMNYDDTCIDKDGNSDVTKALLMLCHDRYKVKYGSTDINTITKRISQYPITPQEAIIRSQGNMFPVQQINERINQQQSTQQQTLTITPTKSVDRKATAKGSISNKYIGFAEGITGSSTAEYARQAGNKANVGIYSPEDTVFVSIPGMRGNAEIRQHPRCLLHYVGCGGVYLWSMRYIGVYPRFCVNSNEAV